MKQVRHLRAVYRDVYRVAPTPEVAAAMRAQADNLTRTRGVGGFIRLAEPRPGGRHKQPGFNDGTRYPPEYVMELSRSLGVRPDSPQLARAMEPKRLEGEISTLVLLVDFEDNPFGNVDGLRTHFKEMLFSTGSFPTGSLSDYYREVSGGKAWFNGTVAGPYRAPNPYSTYTAGQSGTGVYPHNVQRLVEEIVALADADVDYSLFDPDGNNYVDGLVLVHAGPGAEAIVNAVERENSIWSHKWNTGQAQVFDGTNVYTYLTVPENSSLGVWAHEFGHLIFGWPDLYDIDSSSNGLGNYCLMAAGSWNAGGERPAHPCAWCKAKQGWVKVHVPQRDQEITLPPVERDPQVYKLWTHGRPDEEYFLLENRQHIGFDDHLPDTGLAIYHVDDEQEDNSEEYHYMVGLEQADGYQDLELANNNGDSTDLWPMGNKDTFDAGSTPNSKAYNDADSFVSVSSIVQQGDTIRAQIGVGVEPGERPPPEEVVVIGGEPGGCAGIIFSIMRALKWIK